MKQLLGTLDIYVNMLMAVQKCIIKLLSPYSIFRKTFWFGEKVIRSFFLFGKATILVEFLFVKKMKRVCQSFLQGSITFQTSESDIALNIKDEN